MTRLPANLILIFLLSACGVSDTLQQGGAVLKEGSERGWSGFVACQEERDKHRMGLPVNPEKCPPMPSTPEVPPAEQVR